MGSWGGPRIPGENYMKVRMITLSAGPDGVIPAGAVIDVEKKIAFCLIQRKVQFILK